MARKHLMGEGITLKSLTANLKNASANKTNLEDEDGADEDTSVAVNRHADKQKTLKRKNINV
jgi:hypothetical protein